MGGQRWASDAELAPLRRSFTLADLAPLAAAAGVTATVVIQAVAEPWETPDLLALAAGWDPYTGRALGAGAGEPAGAGGLLAGVVGWTDLTAPDVADAVARLRAMPGGAFLCGIRHPVLAERDPGWLARRAVLAGLHALAGLPNVTCKLSGGHTSGARAGDLRPYYQTVLAAFGPGRLLFGSDWPVSTLAAPYGQVCGMYRELTAQLSAGEQEAIFGGTARRVYHLR